MATHPPALRRLVAVAAAVLLAFTLAPAAPAAAAKPTPGDFTGYGFDQCLTPTQSAMDAWLLHSPFWAVGIYISGDSRACRNQPNLTPTWVSTQLKKGWRLLPITLGPQASCSDRFPRYGNDETINPKAAHRYRKARKQGRAEAADAVAAAQRLGIPKGSTLWYDLEAYNTANTACRESALYFTSAWTSRIRALGYVSGVYSSAGSHIKAMDDARVQRPGTFLMPDRIWIARWDGVANTSTDYIREDGWRPGGRMKQYRGGHDEVHGGVRINIDSNFIDLGKGSVARRSAAWCSGTRVDFPTYPTLRKGASGATVTAAQCLLKKSGHYAGRLNGTMTPATGEAVKRFRASLGIKKNRIVGPRVWVALHSHKVKTSVVKYGGTGERVRRLQRALNAASSEQLAITGVFEATTTAAVRRSQARLGLPVTGVVTPTMWSRLRSGRA
ncbi:glycoside hydrolase domain-containing protein [Nocardioides caldifontis]|uniref:glycoside hydrolase domain-containing protein n=1 Tax=Nocardioides caldifontis TaxID=2588938 RepID=UPI0011DF657D|nr:glycoside hydrolase domain-containing protein [Nocardioides caldifontis]